MSQQADEQEQYAGGDADQQSRVDGLLHIVGMARTVEPGHQHVDAVAQTDEETGEQGDEDAGGAYRAEGRGACEPAHHSYVRHIKEHLQQIGQGQRQADQEDLFGQSPSVRDFADELIVSFSLFLSQNSTRAHRGTSSIIKEFYFFAI